jgi:glycosyltransferase involved in cell wall biosynthesis
MIRVLQFANIINRHDFIDTLVNYADPARFEMSVCVRSEESGIAAPEYGPEVKYRVLEGLGKRHIPRAAVKLARLMREWEIDVLHTHHYDQAVIGWLAVKLYPSVRLVVGRHYSDFIYRLPGRLKRGGYLGLEQIINRAAARIVVPSRMIFEILTERQGIDPAKIDVVHYGFASEKYAAVQPEQAAALRREFGMDGRFTVANFSRLNEEKGHRYLVEAAAMLRGRVPHLLVLLVGEGPERANIERQIAKLDVAENVKLAGWRKDAMAIIAASDAVVQSTLQEAFSQAMIEAMWMGKPLVMTDVSGARDVITDGENGLLIPAADAAALASAIERLAADPGLAGQIANAGRVFVKDNLVISKKISEYEAVFEKAANMNA